MQEPNTETFERIDTRIDGYRDRLIDLETLLCSIPALSPDSGGKGELEKCRALEKWLKGAGFTHLERHDAPDARAQEGIRPNLVLTIPGSGSKAGGRLWIMSHLDVVPPGERSLWTGDPWTLRVEGEKLIGRGVEDNQQGLCASVLAACALCEEGFVPPREIKLLFVADEEVGSAFGIQWLLGNRDLFGPEDRILIPDGGDSLGETIEVAEKNLLWLKIRVVGKQCHGSRPDQGINAQLAASDLTLRLHSGLSKAFSERDPLFDPDVSTFEPTKVEANVPNVNTIPGEALFYFDMRILPRYPLSQVLDKVRSISAELEATYGVSVSFEPVQAVESPATPVDSPLVAALSRSVLSIYSQKTQPVGIGGGTVASYLRKRGLHAVVWGRLDETAHQGDEYALVPNILGDAKVMVRMMYEEL